MPCRLIPSVVNRFKISLASSPFNVQPFVRIRHNACISQSAKLFASYHNRNEILDAERGARPLYFQQSPTYRPETREEDVKHRQEQSLSLPLTPYEFLGTASSLPPHARHLSPCLGAALAASPLTGNLMRLGQRQPRAVVMMDDGPENDDKGSGPGMRTDQSWAVLLSRIGFLANNLFFQLIREAPIHNGRNKSMPAAYLTPGIIGCLIAHQYQQSQPSNNRIGNRNEGDPNTILKAELRRCFGIKSNHIYNTQWTGISMARWMDLVIPTNCANASNTGSDIYDVYQQSLVSALWLVALWGVAPSKNSLVDYYEAIERAGIDYYSDQAADIDRTNGFTKDDFAPNKLESAMNQLLEYYSPEKTNAICCTNDDAASARAFELVCGAIVLQQQEGDSSSLPPFIPNGYYAFDGGDTKADCAEVVVREILTLLLWDDIEGNMDISRLPAASPKLRSFLQCLNQQQRENIIPKNEDAQVQQERDLGQAWFDLLSDLPSCDYLAESPNGRPFELAPTSESISKALWHLLVTDVENLTRIDSQPWTSLCQLASYWSQYHQSKPLFVKHERLKHQSGDSGARSSGPLIMEHELISLHLHDNSRVIEIRLRCDFERASGMAAVTHLTKPRQQRLLDPKQVQKLQDVCFRHRRNEEDDKQGTITRNPAYRDPSLVMLCLALQHGHQDFFLPHTDDVTDDYSTVFGSLPWLASSYGADRRELEVVCGDHSLDRDRTILARSRYLLKERILHTCRLCDTHPIFGAHLLSWLLQESPIVVETCSSLLENVRDNDSVDKLSDAAMIEQALLSLPDSVLYNDSVLEAIEWNWACLHRGKLLTRIIRWKLRKLSLWQVFSQSKFHELTEIFSLSRSIE